MEVLLFLEKGIWLGFAAIGFALLFNVPKRALAAIFVIAALGGLTKFFMMEYNVGIVLATLCGASLIGFLSVLAAHQRNCPPITFAIPSVIPMIPGMFTYKAMIAIIELTEKKDPETYASIFFEGVNNGTKAIFIVIALAIGVAVPLLITRKNTVKRLHNDEEWEA